MFQNWIKNQMPSMIFIKDAFFYCYKDDHQIWKEAYIVKVIIGYSKHTKLHNGNQLSSWPHVVWYAPKRVSCCRLVADVELGQLGFTAKRSKLNGRVQESKYFHQSWNMAGKMWAQYRPTICAKQVNDISWEFGPGNI